MSRAKVAQAYEPYPFLVNQAVSSSHDQPLTLSKGYPATVRCKMREQEYREAPNLVRAQAIQMQGELGRQRAV